MDIVKSATAVSMSSREIAELTGKEHKNVRRDIEHMLKELGKDALSFERIYLDAMNRQQDEYHLDRELTETLITGYSIPLRHKVIQRLHELEAVRNRPLTIPEQLLANAQVLVDMDRRTLAVERAVSDLNQQLEQVAESRVWDHCPQNCEPITKIRKRMGAKYGFPAWVVDCVMRELPLSPKVHAMIRNSHESAGGSQYEVWAVADVTRTFARFAADCKRLTACFVTHPDIERPFRMAQQQEVAA
jgi:phage regulator Rha-like protein